MASTGQCLASMARLRLLADARPSAALIWSRALEVSSQCRRASGGGTKKREEKKKTYKSFRSWGDLRLQERYSLVDTLRYLRAFEVGQPGGSVKYDVAVKLRTAKHSAPIKNRIRLPHPISTDIRIAVICPEGGSIAASAREAGAVAVGEESLFQAIKDGNINFNRVICHTESEKALMKAGLGRILGSKGMMPSAKRKTVTPNVVALIRELSGAIEYQEKMGVVRMGIAMLSFTPEMVAENLKAFMTQLKQDISKLTDTAPKDIEEVVFSSTHGPGFSLTGAFQSEDSTVSPEMLATAM